MESPPDIGWNRQPKSAESAFLGNGFLGMRIPPNPLSNPGKLFVAGYEALQQPDGVTSLAELPLPFNVKVSFHSAQSRSKRLVASLKPVEQTLQLSSATLFTQIFAEDSQGRRAKITSEHFACRQVPSLLVMNLTICPEQSGPITLQFQGQSPLGLGVMKVCRASAPGPLGAEAEMHLLYEADGTSRQCGISLMALPDSGTPVPVFRSGCSSYDSAVDCLFAEWSSAEAGREYRLTLIAAVDSDFYHPRPLHQAGRIVQWGAHALGIEELQDKHREAWLDLWKGRILIEGDEASQAASDGCFYALHSSVHPSGRHSLAPFGMSHNGYYGHVFWDCETWCFPPLMLLQPSVGKSILEFRLQTLHAACKVASLYGFQGAQFPWEAAANGMEDTPVWADTGVMQHHIVADVGIAFWQYQCLTGDQEFLQRGTWPVLREVAEWIASRVEKTQRGYEIRHVVGADEYSVNVHNSTHTNLACRKALQAAVSCASAIGLRPPPIWREIADHLFYPKMEDGTPMQQDGWTPEWQSKQADTALTVYPLGIFEDPAEIGKVVKAHVKIDPNARSAVAMGDQINAVLCARAGDRKLARKVWDRGYQPYWIDQWAMFAETVSKQPGCFITGCGGFLQSLLMGFPGLQVDRDPINHFPVALPDGWKSIECGRIFVKGIPYRLKACEGDPRASMIPLE